MLAQLEVIKKSDDRARRLEAAKQRVQRRRDLHMARKERRRNEREVRRIEEIKRRAELGRTPAFLMLEESGGKTPGARAKGRFESRPGAALYVDPEDLEYTSETSRLLAEIRADEEPLEAKIARENRERTKAQRRIIVGDTMLFGARRKHDLLGLKVSVVDQAKARQPETAPRRLTDTQMAAIKLQESEAVRIRSLEHLNERRMQRLAVKERLRLQLFARDLRRIRAERGSFVERFGKRQAIDEMRWTFLGLQHVALPKMLLARLQKLSTGLISEDWRLAKLKSNPAYKTSLCVFRTRQACPHGKYCPFAHSENELEVIDNEAWINWN